MAETWGPDREAEAAEIAKGSQLTHSEFIGKFEGKDRNEARKAVWAAADQFQRERAGQGEVLAASDEESLEEARRAINLEEKPLGLTQRFGPPDKVELSTGGGGLVYSSKGKLPRSPHNVHKDRPVDPTGRTAEAY